MISVCSHFSSSMANIRTYVHDSKPAMPGSASDKTEDPDQMNQAKLMKYAKDILGVETRRVGPDGKKTFYRLVSDVRQDCKAAQARLCQLPQENEAQYFDQTEDPDQMNQAKLIKYAKDILGMILVYV